MATSVSNNKQNPTFPEMISYFTKLSEESQMIHFLEDKTTGLHKAKYFHQLVTEEKAGGTEATMHWGNITTLITNIMRRQYLLQRYCGKNLF